MTRKILFIIIGALLFLALLGLLWFWLLHHSPAAAPQNTGGFATSTNRAAAGGQGQGSDANNASGLSSANGQGQSKTGSIGGVSGGGSINGGSSIPAGGSINGGSGIGTVGAIPNGSAINTGGASINNGTAGSISTAGSGLYTGPQINAPINYPSSYSGTGARPGSGANTSSGSTGFQSGAWVGSSAAERAFTPGQINQINSTAGLRGTPLISSTPQAAGLGSSGLILGAVAAGCAAQYLANQLAGTVATAADPTTGVTAATSVFVIDLKAATQRNETKTQSIYQCLVKSIAQAAVDQITRSVVTWINSGFNGKPSFVTNFNQYFANVADQAAGEFIKGSALSFLCSPFAPQIKIAIAQSYANRNSAASCSLTKVTSNINSFLGGKWGSGGWGGLLQFTTIPTNNPYGAYAYAQIGLNSAVNNAQNNANRSISPSGFISLQKCDPSKNQSTAKGNCQITTPGDVIQSSLNSSLNNPIQGLNLAQDINQIISALTNQVMVKALYGGLGGSLGSVTNPLAPAIDQGASNQAQSLLGQLQTALGYAGQYGGAEQGSISDIQNTQAGLNAAFNCWSTAASSTALGSAQQAQAKQKASSADAAQTALGARITAYNAEITRANAAIATIQNMQSQVLFAATPGDVNAATQAIAAAAAQGVFLTQADVTTAQQNRTTLQVELAAQNQATNASLAQCRALGASTATTTAQ